jgi:hypothetical protein
VSNVPFIYWQQDNCWLGYLQEFPDYWTQGATLEELKENLRSLYVDLTDGNLSGVRRRGELLVA